MFNLAGGFDAGAEFDPIFDAENPNVNRDKWGALQRYSRAIQIKTISQAAYPDTW